MIKDLRSMLVNEYCGGGALPFYEVGGGKAVFLNGHGVPEVITGERRVYLPYSRSETVHVVNSIASCILLACEDQRVHQSKHAATSAGHELVKRDIPIGSVLMSPQTYMVVGDILPERTFVHEAVPHGMALFCGKIEHVGHLYRKISGTDFGILIWREGVVPAIVLRSTDVEMARTRVMDVLDVMQS